MLRAVPCSAKPESPWTPRPPCFPLSHRCTDYLSPGPSVPPTTWVLPRAFPRDVGRWHLPGHGKWIRKVWGDNLLRQVLAGVASLKSWLHGFPNLPASLDVETQSGKGPSVPSLPASAPQSSPQQGDPSPRWRWPPRGPGWQSSRGERVCWEAPASGRGPTPAY